MPPADPSNHHGFAIGVALAFESYLLQYLTGCSTTLAIVTGLVGCFLANLNHLQVQRSIESKVGGFLLKVGTQKLLQKAGLVEKSILIPSKKITLHYHERLPASYNPKTSPTLVLCHGMTSEPSNLASLVSGLAKELPDWRMICPTARGHGKDLERAWLEGSKFVYATPQATTDNLVALLKELNVTQCHVYGASMGGALAYNLQLTHPELVLSTVCISPAVEYVIKDTFCEDFYHGRKNHFCFESRQDVLEFMNDLAVPEKPNPIPSFMLQAIWEDRKKRAPPRHFRNYTQMLLDGRGQDPEWLSAPHDLAPERKRLVLWPTQDFIASHEKGKQFFSKSSENTIFESVPNCGHLFHANGKTVLDHMAPRMAKYLLKGE